jgi:uncharacterized protein (DUF58 family)
MVHDLISEAEDVFGKVTPGMRLEIERMKASLRAGQRHTRKAGPGVDILGPDTFESGVHERKQISAKLSMKFEDREIVVERERESSRRFGLYVDMSGSMDYKSAGRAFTKKQAALIKALVLAADLGVHEDSVAIATEGRFLQSGRRMMQSVAGAFSNHLAIVGTGDIPDLHRVFRRGDSIVWFSDFLPSDDEKLLQFLDEIEQRGLHGFLVMVLDPSELAFEFKGNTEFRGKEGEKSLSGESSKVFDRAESIRAQYLEAMRARIRWVSAQCESRGFTFVLQPTHKPLEDAIHHLKDGQENPLQHVAEITP